MKTTEHIQVALIFTRGVSVEIWQDRGLLSRELSLYHKLSELGSVKFYWISYGLNDNKILQDFYSKNPAQNPITLIQKSSCFSDTKLGNLLYSLAIPFIHRGTLRKVDIIKSNQLDGAWTATLASILYKKRLILRAGYIQSQLESKLRRLPLFRILAIYIYEFLVLRHYHALVVTSCHMLNYLQVRTNKKSSIITTIPNYVDTCLFQSPSNASERPRRMVYIGRLSPEKNLYNLLLACDAVDLSIDLIGTGPEHEALHKLSKELTIRVRFIGNISNSELPQVIHRYKYFGFASFFEGMPKALIEAMACGLIPIACDTTGINNIIADGFDGFLSQDSSYSQIANCIQRADASDQYTISVNAVQKVRKYFSLETIANLELALLSKLSSA